MYKIYNENEQIIITPFFEDQDDCYCFANFSSHKVTLPVKIKKNDSVKQITLKTTEYDYHLAKINFITHHDGTPLTNSEREEFLYDIQNAQTSRAALRLTGRDGKWGKEKAKGGKYTYHCKAFETPNESDPDSWSPRERAMYTILQAKVEQHSAIKALLIATGNSCIVEDTAPSGEKHWGWGNDGRGKNLLGITWMRIRNLYLPKNDRLMENQIIAKSDKACRIRQNLGTTPTSVHKIQTQLCEKTTQYNDLLLLSKEAHTSGKIKNNAELEEIVQTDDWTYYQFVDDRDVTWAVKKEGGKVMAVGGLTALGHQPAGFTVDADDKLSFLQAYYLQIKQTRHPTLINRLISFMPEYSVQVSEKENDSSGLIELEYLPTNAASIINDLVISAVASLGIGGALALAAGIATFIGAAVASTAPVSLPIIAATLCIVGAGAICAAALIAFTNYLYDTCYDNQGENESLLTKPQ